MEFRENSESDSQVLKRIIVTLFALADLAERSAGAPRLIRAFVLWLVRRTETAASGLLLDDDEGIILRDELGNGNGPADAFALAASMRMLALELQLESDQDDLFARWWRNSDDSAAETMFDRIDRVLKHLGALVDPLRHKAFTPAPRLDSS